MGDSRWLRVITVGLFLASLAVAYFLLTGRLTSRITPKTQSQISTATAVPRASVLGQDTPIPVSSDSAPLSAYDRIAERTQGGIQTLPRTGFTAGWVIIFSVSAIISGLGLRKFPN
ncbi:hypothetical protein HYT74_03760 [Candidatus Daviesbacteria bacterium]|nr:hypothetical protein [Candidatus Daviesbacteria bacterium]